MIYIIMTSQFLKLFPTTISINDIATDYLSENLNELAYSLEKSDNNFNQDQYPNGYTSFFTQPKLQTLPETRDLCLHIIKHAKQLYEYYGYNTSQVPIAITALWVSIQRKGAQHGLHCHRMAMFGGTYYSSASGNSAQLMLQTPLETHKMHMAHTIPKDPELADDYYITPTTGRLVLFPGFVNHRVMPHQTDEDRIAWSFNLNYHNFLG
jgi:uncharacterized protein (TIGR02466 family)